MKETLQKHYRSIRQYVIKHNEQVIGISIVSGLILLIIVIAIVVQMSGPRIVYQPQEACKLFTPAEAQQLLGENIIGSNPQDPEIIDNVATSRCSYTDENPDATQMLVAAVAVRSAINDDGLIRNKDEFAAAKANNDADIVTGIGDSAFFNKTNGQLHVLDDKSWIILSYGIGSDQQSNTPEKVSELAKLVVDKK
jgi:hypothetical protein